MNTTSVATMCSLDAAIFRGSASRKIAATVASAVADILNSI